MIVRNWCMFWPLSVCSVHAVHLVCTVYTHNSPFIGCTCFISVSNEFITVFRESLSFLPRFHSEVVLLENVVLLNSQTTNRKGFLCEKNAVREKYANNFAASRRWCMVSGEGKAAEMMALQTAPIYKAYTQQWMHTKRNHRTHTKSIPYRQGIIYNTLWNKKRNAIENRQQFNKT